MSYRTAAELDALVQAFESCTLPKAEWTHAAHLTVGLWHVERYGPGAALLRLRAGIRRLNESHGVENTATGGYHETITAAYVTLLAEFAERFAALAPVARTAVLLSGPLAERHALLAFYSKTRLMSVEARLGLVQPDLGPLAIARVLDDAIS
ncbi:MAG: hypothetical protein JSR73_04125 [Proteobacteria bacterium]|nr:hypothetical protein [Pseudomonadota bacterium]